MAGQPLALDLWRDLFALTGDVDSALIPLLQDGVPTGYKAQFLLQLSGARSTFQRAPTSNY